MAKLSAPNVHRLGDLQLQILKTLWARGEATVAAVHGELGREPRFATTTIATMLRKREARGLVAHRADGRTAWLAAWVAALALLVRSAFAAEPTVSPLRSTAGSDPGSAVESGPPVPAAASGELKAVYVVRVAETGGAQLRRDVMDVLVQRLAACEFAAAQWEPRGTDGLLVQVTAPSDESLAEVPALLQRKGGLELRCVHPESDGLLQQGVFPAGYEAMAERSRPDQAARVHLVAQQPSGPRSGHVTSAVALVDPATRLPRVEIAFSDEGAGLFASLTRTNAGRQIALVVEGEILMAPRVRQEILGGRCVITGQFSTNEARLLAALIAYPLPGRVALVAGTDQASARGKGFGQEKASREDVRIQSSAENKPPQTAAPAAATPPAEVFETRVFRINPNLMIDTLQRVGSDRSSDDRPAEILRRSFCAAGADLGGAATRFEAMQGGALGAPTRKTLLFNEQTGLLLVRAAVTDLEIVEKTLVLLNDTPPHVMIETKLVEITGTDERALGLDWLWGNAPLALVNTNTATGSNALLTVTGVTTDPQFRQVIQGLDQAATNVIKDLRGDQLEWGGKRVTNAPNIRLSAALGPAMTGFLTGPQYRLLLRALEQRRGVEVLSTPRVTTLSGQQAQIQVVNVMAVLTGLNPGAIVQPGIWGRTNVPAFTTAQIPVGPALDLLPVVAADGRTIELTVTPTLTEFLGYDAPPKDGRVRVWQNGVKKRIHPPLPRFRVRQMQTKVRVQDGQTLLLATWPVKDSEKTPADKSTSGRAVHRRLLVFVTPTIVDQAGNRTHSGPPGP